MLQEVELTKQIAELNDEMWKEFNAQYEKDQIKEKQETKKSTNLKLVNLEDDLTL